jgi:hypothetical protein
MPIFTIHCARLDDETEIHFGGGPEARGNPEYRGFSCQSEVACKQAGIPCELFTTTGYRPFEVKDAFEFFNS